MVNTVVGLFNDRSRAQAVVEELVSNGFRREDINVTQADEGAQSSSTATTTPIQPTTTGTETGSSIGNFFRSLFGGESSDYTDINQYTEAVNRGNTLVAVTASSDALIDRAADIMNSHGAIDIDEGTAQQSASATTTATAASQGTRTVDATEGAVALPVIEEELQVGKRAVRRGGVRVHSRIVEMPVEETVRLRDEQITVERRAVDRPIANADFDALQNQVIELTETDEVAVVAKQARVVEEVVVGKDVVEREETIRDTVRRTDVEVEEVNVNTEQAKRAGGQS